MKAFKILVNLAAIAITLIALAAVLTPPPGDEEYPVVRIDQRWA
ncbi:MAG TPA: hypothetical protein VKT73_13040 [Xanthobacteraceae bacterium]|nr:hypothetical protein [Xanthobacteraceae bacterium]